MPAKNKALTSDNPVVITFLILALIAFAWLAAEVLKPLALAILLSFALAPLAGFLQRRGLPRAVAVMLTVVLLVTAIGAIGYKVGEQLTGFTKDIDRYEANIRSKIQRFKLPEQGAVEKLAKAGERVSKTLDQPLKGTRASGIPVTVVSEPSIGQRLQSAVGPYVEGLGVGVFVLILVVFILANREDLSDRLVRLGGESRVGLTTRTMEEVGDRISRYLMMFATVNSAIGVAVGLGLWAIGVPYATLWGFLAATFRFLPYVGPATAFALPLLFSVAYFPGWREPLMVVALFALLETVGTNFLEPLIYGRTTGVTALGLLVAAMFWTWLWGLLGLVLSTPLTVCLAVMGKYVPGLSAFATLLGEEPPLTPEMRFYQRLLALDQDDAMQIIDTAFDCQTRAEVFDEILIPILSRASRDRARDEITENQQLFIERVIGELLDDMDAPSAIDRHASPRDAAGSGQALVLGVAASDAGDTLALRMLSVLLATSECPLEIVTCDGTPLELTERLAEIEPDLVILSHLPPAGATTARYLVRRLRARFPGLPILVGRWGAVSDPQAVVNRLTSIGATHVALSLTDAHDRILDRVAPREQESGAPLPSDAPEAVAVS